MFELRAPRGDWLQGSGHQRTGSFLKELRRQSRVFVDDDPEEEDGEGDTSFEEVPKTHNGHDADACEEEGFGDDEDNGEIEVEGERGLGIGVSGQ